MAHHLVLLTMYDCKECQFDHRTTIEMWDGVEESKGGEHPSGPLLRDLSPSATLHDLYKP
jgi:hypothetical protein